MWSERRVIKEPPKILRFDFSEREHSTSWNCEQRRYSEVSRLGEVSPLECRKLTALSAMFAEYVSVTDYAYVHSHTCELLHPQTTYLPHNNHADHQTDSAETHYSVLYPLEMDLSAMFADHVSATDYAYVHSHTCELLHPQTTYLPHNNHADHQTDSAETHYSVLYPLEMDLSAMFADHVSATDYAYVHSHTCELLHPQTTYLPHNNHADHQTDSAETHYSVLYPLEMDLSAMFADHVSATDYAYVHSHTCELLHPQTTYLPHLNKADHKIDPAEIFTAVCSIC
ncbi:hypothetical protein J6590_013979 [Homalodisca vitripennis]|nr:hypothetical protein J6590_013979 [Homalodisca vitripennis]